MSISCKRSITGCGRSLNISNCPVSAWVSILFCSSSTSFFRASVITLAGTPGLRVTKEGLDTIVYSLDPGIADQFIGPCEKYADAGDCGFEPIRKLSGVTADEEGVITLRFVPHDWSG